jgi:hypothetical protein
LVLSLSLEPGPLGLKARFGSVGTAGEWWHVSENEQGGIACGDPSPSSFKHPRLEISR